MPLYNDFKIKADAVGTYYVWYWVRGSGDADIVAPTYIEAGIYGESLVTKKPTVNAGLKYTGADQKLLKTSGETSTGKLQYCVVDEGSPYGNSWDDWKNDYTKITKKTPGSYWIWYRVVNDDGAVLEAPAKLTVTIGKADSPIQVIANQGLVYGNTDQPLVSLVTGGADNYVSLSVDGGTFDGSIPKVAELAKGKHTVAWKCNATANYAGSEGSVTVKIDPAVVTVTIPQANSLTYNGTEQLLVSQGTAEGNNNRKYSFYFRLDGTETWGLADTIKGKDAGEYTVYYKIVEAGSKADLVDPRNNYRFVMEYGSEPIAITGTLEAEIKAVEVTGPVLFDGMQANILYVTES